MSNFGAEMIHAQSIRHFGQQGQGAAPNTLRAPNPRISGMQRIRRSASTARETIAANMRHLKERHGDGKPLSNRQIAIRADVAPGTVDKLCRTTGPSPQLDKIEAVAAAFKLEAWQLLMPELPAMLGHTGEVSKILDSYLHTDKAGREMLNGVAERIAGYQVSRDS